MAIRNTDCFDFCNPACPYYYNCHEPPVSYFSLYLPTSPPPYLGGGFSNVSPSLLIVVFFLIGGFSILIGYYVIIRKHCFNYRRWGRDYQPPSPPGIGNEEFMGEDRMDNPILPVTTIGLHRSIMNATTVYKYQKGDGMIEGSECSVCLSDFQEEEMLRLLPTCNHAFHVQCIDTWLMSHTNCPLCRGNIMSPPTVEKQHSSRAQIELLEYRGEDLDVTRDAQTTDTRGNGGLDENLNRDEDLGNHQQTGRLQEESVKDIVSKEHHSPLNIQEEIEPVGLESNRMFYLHSLHSSSSCFSPSTSEHKIYVNDQKSPESTNYRKLDAGVNSLLKRGSSADMSSARKYAVPIARSQSCDPGTLLVHYE